MGTTRSVGDCPSGSIQSARGWKGGRTRRSSSSKSCMRSLPGPAEAWSAQHDSVVARPDSLVHDDLQELLSCKISTLGKRWGRYGRECFDRGQAVKRDPIQKVRPARTGTVRAGRYN